MNLDSLSLALSQISYLVDNLTKKNYRASQQEIQHVSRLMVLQKKLWKEESWSVKWSFASRFDCALWWWCVRCCALLSAVLRIAAHVSDTLGFISQVLEYRSSELRPLLTL